nr:MAG TPA: hypothetical protein [Caudoviricetes sp.]
MAETVCSSGSYSAKKGRYRRNLPFLKKAPRATGYDSILLS